MLINTKGSVSPLNLTVDDNNDGMDEMVNQDFIY
jgi:hypothetical protein